MAADAQRIVAGTSATLTWQGVDQDGEADDPGAVTVGVVRSDGSSVVAAGTATSGTGASVRGVTLTVAQTALLDVLTATWDVGGVTVATTRHEVVGGVYVTLAEVRQAEPSLADAGEDTRATLLRARSEVEAMFEQVTGLAFVPRFDVVEAHHAWPKVTNLRGVRWVKYVGGDGTVTAGATTDWYDLSPFELDYTVRAGVEHGLDRPPADVKRAAITAIRHQVNQAKSGIDARAMSFQPIDGGNVVLATPGLGPWVTGIPAVDEVLKRYKVPEPAGLIRVEPVSRSTWSYRPDLDWR